MLQGKLGELSCRENSPSCTSNHVLRCLSCNPSPPSNKHLSASSLAYVYSYIFWVLFCSIVKRLQKALLSFLYSWKNKLIVRLLLLNEKKNKIKTLICLSCLHTFSLSCLMALGYKKLKGTDIRNTGVWLKKIMWN